MNATEKSCCILFPRDLFLQGKDNWSDYSNMFMKMTAEPLFTSLKYKITTYSWEFSGSQKAKVAPEWLQRKLWHSKNILAECICLYFLKRGRNFKGIKMNGSRSWVNSVVFLKGFLKTVICYLRSWYRKTLYSSLGWNCFVLLVLLPGKHMLCACRTGLSSWIWVCIYSTGDILKVWN